MCICVYLGITGCRQDMHDQPRYKPLAGYRLFRRRTLGAPGSRRHRGARPSSHRRARYTGKVDGRTWTISLSDYDRQIWSAASSGSIFTARPVTAGSATETEWWCAAGFRQAASYHTEKLIKAPIGHFFDVITNGFGAMPSYASRVEPDDRWRIAAYIRVLQLSENASSTIRRHAPNWTRTRHPKAASRSHARAATAQGAAK